MAKKKVVKVIEDTEAVFGYLKGKCEWAKVLEVDDYGNYSVDIYPAEEDMEAFKAHVEPVLAEAEAEVEGKAKAINEVVPVVKTKEGKEYIQFKLPELNWKDEPNHLEFYDLYGKKVENWDKLIGNGSILKIKYRAAPYYMNSTKNVGLSYRFYAVQVIDLVEYSGKGQSGFGDETGGGDAPFGTDEEF
jgi:hypothetical protein